MASSTANDVNIPVKKSRSRTDLKVTKFSHTWTISNFRYCGQETGQFLKSVTFPLGDDDEHNTTKWCLQLYPKGINGSYKEYLSLYISPVVTPNVTVTGTWRIGIVNAKGERCCIYAPTVPIKFDLNFMDGLGTFANRTTVLAKTQGLMQDDNLVLFCDIEAVTDISNTSENVSAIQFTESKGHLLGMIEDLFETKKFSDFTITACGKEFQVHKYILAVQSPVFSAAIEHDMQEKKENRIDICDIDDKVVEEMLLYLYTGRVNNIQEIAVGLLAAANKYLLKDLKTMCEEELRASLTIENAADTLILADLHSADQLKPRVISFIGFHAADVVTTVGFQLMVLSHPSLCAEVFGQISLKKNADLHDVSKTDAAASK